MTRRAARAGFTAAEMLVATMIGAVVIGTAALAFGTLARGQRDFTKVVTVTLPNGAQNNFYGVNSNTITTYAAPNFGSVARAESMRERFHTDVAQAIAVYCLYRDGTKWNTVRPTTLPAPAYGIAMDTPEAFRKYLKDAVTGSDIFKSYRNDSDKPNVSIFVLGYSTNATTIPVIAVYDINVVDAKDPSDNSVNGTYASVRRYAAGSLTSYYDIFYEDGGKADKWTPVVVVFERRSRKADPESTKIESFKVAAGRPFYFLFWPDPAEDSMELPLDAKPSGTLNGSYLTTDPRRYYNHMAGRTSYMFVVPMFPSF